jgi:hypothetical protein
LTSKRSDRDSETKIYGQAREIEIGIEIERCASKVSADEVRRRDKVPRRQWLQKCGKSKHAHEQRETQSRNGRGERRRKWQRGNR